MGDLKTNWSNPPVDDVGLAGDGITSRGGDPNVDTGGTSALDTMWKDQPVPDMPVRETANSVSGLPLQPSRFAPSGTPPPPPSLKDRSPGTIDEQ